MIVACVAFVWVLVLIEALGLCLTSARADREAERQATLQSLRHKHERERLP